MSAASTKSGWGGFGHRRTGLEHERSGEESQDAWALKHYAVGSIVVVCDGLGSKKHSAFGATQACRAACDAFRYWAPLEDAPERGFLALLHNLWRLRVHGLGRRDCATTCLIAAATPQRLLLAQLGDGLLALKRPGESTEELAPGRTGYLNETLGLGMGCAIDQWHLQSLPIPPKETTLVLCTDGLSEELDPDHLDAFVDWVRDTPGLQRGSARHATLRRELGELQSHQRADDITLAALWRTT